MSTKQVAVYEFSIPVLILSFLIFSFVPLVTDGRLRNTPVAAFEESAACANGIRLGTARNFPLGYDPEDLLTGDFNGDGFLDLAIANSGYTNSGGLISLYAGNGRGEFANVSNLHLTSWGGRLASGDFNNDGKLDLATAVPFDGSGVAVALGKGDGSFSTTLIPIGPIQYRAGIVVTDFNADGKADIALSGENKVIVMRGDGAGGFMRVGNYETGATMPGALSAGDFSGDGKPDLIVFGQDIDQKPILFLNDGAGQFLAGIPLNISGSGSDFRNAVGDLNGDGKADLAFVRRTDQEQRGVSVAFSTGAGFGEPIQIPLSGYGYPVALRMADLNGDGKPDVIATEDFGNRISIVLNNGGGTFSVRSIYSGGYFPVASAAGDFDRDGKTDLAVINYDQTLSIITGLGAGQFIAPLAFDQADKILRATVLADLNTDAKKDVVVALGNQAGVLVAYGDGAGSFGSPKTYMAGRDNSDVVVADFNKDSKPDIVVVGGNLQSAGSVNLLLANAMGEFNLDPRNFTAGQTPSTVVAADLNGDRNQDLVVGNYGSNDISILMGDGKGNFSTAINIPVGISPSAIGVGDFNKDGNLDLVVANYGESTLSILLGSGSGGFIPVTVAVAKAPVSLTVADFNRDNNLDLAVIHRDESTNKNLYILMGNGDGSFRLPIKLATENFPISVAAGDFTGDGKLDLALTEIPFLTNTSSTDHVSLYAGNGTGNFVRSGSVSVPLANYLTAGDLNNDGMMDLAVTTRVGISSALSVCTPAPMNTVANVSAASYQPLALATDSIAAAFGANLATTTVVAPGLPLPTELAGTRIVFKDAAGIERAAPLFFVSPFQINYLVPSGMASGVATVTVTSGNGQITTGVILITPTLPGLFTANSDGAGPPAGYVLRVKSNGAQVIEPLIDYDPAQGRFVPRPINFYSDSATQPDQIYLVVFGTGIRNRGSLGSVEAALDGSINAEVLYAAAQGDYVGLDQVNIKLPLIANRPTASLVVVVDGKPSNPVQLKFK
ncbi:MAG: VCBS repeat-containing protein [Acidobacteria bacterium]|nr:VCBS repeat-containing protein [Acidobacteriota bacterium]